MKYLAILILAFATVSFVSAQGRGNRGGEGPDVGDRRIDDRRNERGDRFGANSVITDTGYAIILDSERVDNGDDTFSIDSSIKAYNAAGIAWENDLAAHDGKAIGGLEESGSILAFTAVDFPDEAEREAGVEPIVTLVALNVDTGVEAWSLVLPNRGELGSAGNGGFFLTYGERTEATVTINLAFIQDGGIVYTEVLATRDIDRDEEETNEPG